VYIWEEINDGHRSDWYEERCYTCTWLYDEDEREINDLSLHRLIREKEEGKLYIVKEILSLTTSGQLCQTVY
jgi:hypothetical protein